MYLLEFTNFLNETGIGTALALDGTRKHSAL